MAEVVELVDTLASGASAARHRSSSLLLGTRTKFAGVVKLPACRQAGYTPHYFSLRSKNAG